MSITSLIKSGVSDEKTSEEYTFFLDGDISQMSNQKSFLIEQGISVGQNNVYPVLEEKDVKKALILIWSNKVDGWWHYKKEYVELGICTDEEWSNALGRQVNR